MIEKKSVQAKPEDFTESGSSPPTARVIAPPQRQSSPSSPSKNSGHAHGTSHRPQTQVTVRRRSRRRSKPPHRGRGGVPSPPRAREGGGDPHRMARLFRRRHGTDESGRLTLRRWGRGWWRYEDGAYVLEHDEDLTARMTSAVKREFDTRPVLTRNGTVRPVTKGLVHNVINALASLEGLRVPDTVTLPAWLGEPPEDREYLAVENGLLDVPAFLTHTSVVLQRHTPEWFTSVCLPYAFDPEATCPQWTQFTGWMFHEDDQLIQFVQEWFGYCLVLDHSQQVFVVVVGDGANGKSVLLETLKHLVGQKNCSSVALESFDGRFDLAMTIGKLVNIVSEIGDVAKLPEGKLKSFVAGDLMTFDRKHREPLQVNPTARLVFATNKLPTFTDRSDGIWRRFIPLPCDATIAPRDQDRTLPQKLQTELPGILNWALAGLARLRKRGCFGVPEAAKRLIAVHRGASHPELLFLQEYCEAQADAEIGCTELYRSYQNWCELGGHLAMDDGQFGKALRKRFVRVDRLRRRQQGKQLWVYGGVKCSY